MWFVRSRCNTALLWYPPHREPSRLLQGDPQHETLEVLEAAPRPGKENQELVVSSHADERDRSIAMSHQVIEPGAESRLVIPNRLLDHPESRRLARLNLVLGR